MSKAKALAVSTITVMIGTFAGRIFGFVREMVMSYKYGASAQMDAFLVAFTIPNILYSLVVMGALSASFIPIFTGLITNDKERDAWRLAQSVFNLLLIVFGAIILLLVLFAPAVIGLVAPGFKGSAQLTLSANLLRVMAPGLIFLGISGLMAGVLNSHNHFAAPSFVSLAQNILLVATVLILAGSFGIYAAAIGLLAGAAGQVLIQLPVFIKRRISLKPALVFRHESLPEIGKLFLPVLIALAASQANVIVDKWFASQLSEGSISYLNYAFKVGSLPSGTLIAAVAIVLFPTLSAQAAHGDLRAMRTAVATGIRVIILVALPAAVGLFVLSTPITALLFQQGAFTAQATAQTAPALAAYSFGILAMGLSALLMRAFYSLKDGITPLVASLVFVVFLSVLDYLLVKQFTHVGLAAGYAISMTIMVGIMLYKLRDSLHGLEGSKTLLASAKMMLAALAMGLATWIVQNYLFAPVADASKSTQFLTVSVAITVGVVVYVVTLLALRVDDIMMVWRMFKSRFSKVEQAVT